MIAPAPDQLSKGLAAPVSVVVPCFRCKATIKRAIASIESQTARPLEIILVDDASGDGTFETLLDIQQRLGADRIKVIALERNVGAGEARNAGWNSAAGAYVAFLDADDSWHPRKLEIQHQVMLDRPDIALSAHRHVIDANADIPLEVESLRLTAVSAATLLWRNRFVTPSVMVRRSVSKRFHGSQRHMEDHLLWMQIAYSGLKILMIELPLAVLHKPAFGASGQSADLLAMERAELGNYRLLRSEGRIGGATVALLSAWSVAKFLRRLLIVAGRKLSRTPATAKQPQ